MTTFPLLSTTTILPKLFLPQSAFVLGFGSMNSGNGGAAWITTALQRRLRMSMGSQTDTKFR